jgi:hypothetical protein
MDHERRICPSHRDISSRGDRKKLDRSLIDQHLGMLRFYGNIRRSEIFVCANTIFADGVFLTQMSSNVGISV